MTKRANDTKGENKKGESKSTEIKMANQIKRNKNC